MAVASPQTETFSVFLQGYLSRPDHFFEVVSPGSNPQPPNLIRKRFIFKQASFSGFTTDLDPSLNPMHGQIGLYVSGLTDPEVQKLDDFTRNVVMSTCMKMQGKVSLMCNHGTVCMREVTLWLGIPRNQVTQTSNDIQNQQFAGHGSGPRAGNSSNIANQAAQPWDGFQNQIDNGNGSSSSFGNVPNSTVGNNSQNLSQDLNGAARAA
ncbi:uncharacterized protein CCOS01_10498 [Colletotrichum costaricense]|uniref:Uncharacterized protein n=1 Tax=Colletotrichum costaricense TaxID=1209916 RepID=A0AAI9YRB5_9PEZI|nr:uncharacterized protein CCOS01_10498 [Colletotrichum costaricense]KAI3529281.1 hypothetical protein CSPX01_15596 [Colletotrichum filicis]KAK1520379.1 hypothetical protein CCOS01_10498 [Colletotrichum costaricense]